MSTMGIINHIMVIYNFPIMEIVPQTHQWEYAMGITVIPLGFPLVGMNYIFLCILVNLW